MLKQLREKQGFTQAELAKKFGFTSPQFISNIERGLSMLPTCQFKKASKILNVSIPDLIDWKVKHTEQRLRKALRA